jgi:SH3-like domain-containing protein
MGRLIGVRRRRAAVISGVLALAAGALGAGLPAANAQPAPPDRPTPSGFAVPRYVSLKFDKVNARAGPSDDHRLLWVYRVRSLPVQVVAETAEWRRVCDPDGQLAWVHKRTTDGRRTVMNTTRDVVPMRSHPRDNARIAALLKPRALASLVRCENGWCRIKADDAGGWVREGQLWGTAEALQCRPSAPAGRLGR